MKTRLDMDRIADGLGAERRGKVAAGGGYFGAIQLLTDIQTHFRVANQNASSSGAATRGRRTSES